MSELKASNNMKLSLPVFKSKGDRKWFYDVPRLTGAKLTEYIPGDTMDVPSIADDVTYEGTRSQLEGAYSFYIFGKVKSFSGTDVQDFEDYLKASNA